MCNGEIEQLRLLFLSWIIILLISLISQTENQGQTEWIGDGFCDDINNNEVCDFDNGDCCGAKVKKQFCLNCTCIGKCILSYWCQTVCKIFVYYIHKLMIKNLGGASLCYSDEDCNGNGYCHGEHCICLPNYNFLHDCSHYGCKYILISLCFWFHFKYFHWH